MSVQILDQEKQVDPVDTPSDVKTAVGDGGQRGDESDQAPPMTLVQFQASKNEDGYWSAYNNFADHFVPGWIRDAYIRLDYYQRFVAEAPELEVHLLVYVGPKKKEISDLSHKQFRDPSNEELGRLLDASRKELAAELHRAYLIMRKYASDDELFH